jgi:RecA-family ATPase
LTDLAKQRSIYSDGFAELSADDQAKELARLKTLLAAKSDDVQGPDLTTMDLPERPDITANLDPAIPRPEPIFVVDRMFVRKTVNILSGDTGAAKSILANALTVSAALGTDWLGFNVYGSRTLVVDEENPEDVCLDRIVGLGATKETLKNIKYFNLNGVALGTAEDIAWLRHEAEAHQADLIIVDTAMAATNADVDSNMDVVALYRALRPIAKDLDLAILILHHERKTQAGAKVSEQLGHEMMGARQWAGQADTHLQIKVHTPIEDEEMENSTNRYTRSEFLLYSSKVRTGINNLKNVISVTSEMTDRSRLLWMQVQNEGRLEDEKAMTQKHTSAIVNYLNDHGEERVGVIAAGINVDQRSGSFQRALNEAVAHKLILNTKRGFYKANKEGLEF